MLISLARRISDLFLPEAFYGSTLTNADGCPQCSPEEEDDLVMAFDHKMQDALAEKSWSIENLDRCRAGVLDSKCKRKKRETKGEQSCHQGNATSFFGSD
jgi:hypothetical protein